MDYSGKIITKNAVTPTQTAASGVWTLDDALQAQKGNNWPIPGVPNPISKSLRFNSADSAYLNRTPTIQGNRQKFTWSGWIKRSKLGLDGPRMFVAGSGSDIFIGRFLTSDAFQIVFFNGTNYGFNTVQVFRDVSSWYHFVIAVDTTQATDTNRFKLYVNGSQVTNTTSLGALVPQNTNLPVNNTVAHSMGIGGGNYFDGYLTEINFVDGQALAASDFGMTDTNTGVWIPKKYTGTYGTNGFYVNFKDATNTSTLGYDYSGNGNNWNANNFSVTAGAGNDSLTDVPTPWVGYSVNGDTGGVVRGNYATMNPLYGTGITANFYTTNGNLDLNVDTNSGYRNLAATFSPENFKGYFEVYCSTSPNFLIGFAFESISPSNVQYQNAGTLYINNAGDVKDGLTTIKSSCTPSFSSTDVLQVAFDFTNGARNVWFGRNGTWGSNASGVGVPSTGTNPVLTSSNITSASRFYFGINSGAGTVTIAANFGQRPFAYTPPAGFKSLCTTNLPTPTIGATSTTQANDYFNTVLYTGTGSSLSVTGVGFQPDFVWIKGRSGVTDHGLYDAVRGVQKQVESNTTTLETTETTGLTAFGTDGFTVGALAQLNTSTATYVGWNWKANGAGSSNTAGTISSTVSVNTTSGFSIVTYTGNGTAGATIGHGLGAAPSMIIVKKRTGGAQTSWPVYHKDLGNTKYLDLNSSNNASTDITRWNNTSPTSTVFTAGDAGSVNGSGFVYVAYCFAPIEGYSAFGSYTGNGSADGPFVYLGFRPRFLLTKRTNAVGDWYIWDAARNPSNVVDLAIWPNYSSAEYNYGGDGTQPWDFLSNGIKARTSSLINNNNGDTYIYAAFSENPFKYSNAR